MLSVEAANTSFIIFTWTRLALKPMIYHTQGKHTNVVLQEYIPVLKIPKTIYVTVMLFKIFIFYISAIGLHQ